MISIFLFVCLFGFFFCLVSVYFCFVFQTLCYHFFVDFSNFTVCHFSFPIAFWLSQLTATAEGEFKQINVSGIVYPYLSTPIGKPFLVSIFWSCSLPIKSSCHRFFELFLVITITVLKLVSCDHVTSFNCDDKKARDVGLTC